MPRDAAVIETACPARSEAHPLRPHDPRRVRAGVGAASDDRHLRNQGSEAPAARSRASRRLLAGIRVLVVDDDTDVLELFALALTSFGAEVTTIDNARDAVALAARTKPHAVVSDIAMPGEDGYWLVRELRRLPLELLGAVPVVAATAYGREHPRARVLAAGFTEHLQKPIDPEQLCRVVASIVGR